jgi:tRNA A-37 threonylcarbamoyl transferase component Bud32
MLAGRYRLVEQIAAGGSGEVWRGLDVVLERSVAVKLLRAERAADPQAVAQFRAEARHASALSHRGIVQIHDYGDADPPHPPFLVMELVDGVSIAALLASGPLDPARVLDVVAQTAAGLGAAHRAGLVHCDIKPGNLLITSDGQVKITDFGIAHMAGSSPDTRTGTLAATPAYLAPERLAGAPATPASDIYSLGIMAYECLVGVPPFTGERLEVAVAHREHPVPPLPAPVPAEVAALVSELTAKDPAARPASADSVAGRAGDLRDRLAGQAAEPPRTRTDLGQTATLTDLSLPAYWLAPRRLPGGPRLAGRSALVAGIAAVAASLLGLGLAGVLASASPDRQLAAVSARTAAPGAVAAVATVQVNNDQLTGQPVDAVRRELQQLGLSVRVVWLPGGGQPAAKVLSVHPSGRVPVGSVITVTAAQAKVLGQVDEHGKGGHGDGGNDQHGGGDGGG